MPKPYRLRGMEQEVVRMKRSGMTEYKIAVALGVYPNAIRQLLIREAKREQEEPVGK